MTFRLVSAISKNETGITSRYFEITSILVFYLLEELTEDISWPHRDKKFRRYARDQTSDETVVLFLRPDVEKIENSFFTDCFFRLVTHRQ